MGEIEWTVGSYDNGKIHYEIPYVNDKKNGLYKIYNYDGSILYETPYVNDNVHGVDTGYYYSGDIRYENYYIHGDYVTKEEWREHELITQLAKLDE